MKINTTAMLAAAFALSLCGTVRAGEGRKPDAWITAKVKSALAGHKNVSAVGTNVDTENGIVTLRGEVDTQAEKDLAARYAKEVEGVRSVNNELVIKRDDDGAQRGDRSARADVERATDRAEGSGDRALNRAEGAGDRALDKAEEAKDDAVDGAKGDGDEWDGERDGRGIGDKALGGIGNAALTSRVKAALAANKGTSAMRTNVDSARGGRVVLRGTARSDAERDLAGKIAKDVEGVKSVDNKIKVRAD